MAPKNDEEEQHQLDLSSERFVFEDDVNSEYFLNHDDHEEISGNCGRAIVREFKRTVGTWWLKEMINFNGKTIAVSFFIFFAAVAPAITFGAVYSKVTNDAMGAVEMLVATAWCGIVYALIGGQPIVSRTKRVSAERRRPNIVRE